MSDGSYLLSENTKSSTESNEEENNESLFKVQNV